MSYLCLSLKKRGKKFLEKISCRVFLNRGAIKSFPFLNAIQQIIHPVHLVHDVVNKKLQTG